MPKYSTPKALPFCSSLAIATALLSAGPAAGQSFQGTGTFNSGTGTITAGSSTTTVSITSTDAVIDWTTFDTATNPGVPIDFQPAGTTTTFSSTGDFAVLNRILPSDPSRPVQFNGTVLSRIATAAGGTVYFYSPGGVIVGATATFDVGNLGLTSVAPEVVGGVFEQGSGSKFVRYNGPVVPGSAVTIQPGARITGTGAGGSYLAIVAPQITQSGSIDGKKSVALVSADAATLTFNPNGLFDIQVSSGTSATGTTLFNNGSIAGPAGDAGNASRLYMVAVPKNDAITMAIGSGSTLGFDIADAADIVGNAIVLSAGYDVAGGVTAGIASPGGGTGQARIDLGASAVTSALSANATGRAIIFAGANQSASFASDVTLTGTQDTSDPLSIAVQFNANGAGARINVAGDLVVTALDPTQVAPGSGYQVTNFAVLDATNGGTITVSGNASVLNDRGASAPGANLSTGAARIATNAGGLIQIGGNATVSAGTFIASSGSATGGNAGVSAIGAGRVEVAGVMRVLAYGIAGANNGIGGAGGAGQGGTARVSVDSGGAVLAGELNVAADGVGGANAGAGAGSGTGGLAELFAQGTGSAISIANGNVTGDGNLGELDFVSAEGFGGRAATSGVGGIGAGGTANISVLSGATLTGPSTLGSLGNIRILARGTGGGAGTGATAGGQATGGTLAITVDNATMTSADLLPSAVAQGGSALPASSGAINGGNAVGGTRDVTVRNGGVLTASLAGGSAGAVGGTGTASGRGGDASGGLARLNVDTGTFNVPDRALFFIQNTGGDGGTGGNATGGQVFASVVNGGAVNVGVNGPNQLFLISADNRGGNSLVAPGVAGGNGTGGIAQLVVDNGTISSPNLRITALGFGGNGPTAQAGSGTGGTARLQLRGGTLSGINLLVSSIGTGGSVAATTTGDAGTGTGGFATLEATANATTLNFATIDVRGDGAGGNAQGPGGSGGAAIGGTAQIFATNGAVLTANASDGIAARVDALGGFASGTGNGGNATAGQARLVITNATIAANGPVEVSGTATGGNGVAGGSAFGNPVADTASANVSVSAGLLTVTGSTSLSADLTGGAGRDGGRGGNAGIGFALLFAHDANGAVARGAIDLQDVVLTANGLGGFASGTGDGGSASGGRTQIFVNGGDIDIAGSALSQSIATGGDGLNGGDAISPQPFRVPRSFIGSFNGTVDVTGSASFEASAFGGNAVAGGGGRGGTAFAGQAGIDAQSQVGPSAVTVGDLFIDVSASGGSGGFGLAGQIGGQGGDAYGGFAFAQGNAGRGVLTVTGSTVIDARALGGTGGEGGSGGTTSAGGNGGAGGRAFGGSFSPGTVSGFDTPGNSGSASFGFVTASAEAVGGDGGDGGLGTTQGNGGSGGLAFGGSGGILVRGSPATFGDVFFDASAIGGNGGIGSVDGVGGDAYAGDLSVTVTQRFNRTERGSLTAGNLLLFADAIGGDGSTTGSTFFSAAAGTERGLFVRQSDVTLGSLSISTSGAFAPNLTTTVLQVQDQTTGLPVPTQVSVVAEPLDISLAQSTVNIATGLFVSTPGAMTLSLDNSTLTVPDLTLSAGNFVIPATRPATFGTLNVTNSLSIISGLDFLAYANILSPAGGLFDVDGSLATGDITTPTDVTLSAGGSITTGIIRADSLFLTAGQAVTTLSVDANQQISIVAGGPVTTGNLSAGGSVPGAGKVAIASSGGTVTTGTITSTGDLGIQSSGPISTGALVGRDILLLSGAGLSTGSITALDGGQPTGAIYFGNVSQASATADVFQPFRNAGGLLSIFGAAPAPAGGAVTFAGAVQGGSVRGAGTGTLSAQAITAVNAIDLQAGGLASVNAAWTAPSISLVSGDISIGTSGSLDALSATGSIVLASTNAAGATIGDGQGGSGYVLDNAEFSRIRAGDLIVVGADTGLAADMTIGNLTVTGAQLYGAGGGVSFAVGDRITQTPAGTLRVAGALEATSFAATNELALLGGTVEVEATRGSVRLADASNRLGGLLYIEADHIHVASDAILTRLRADPLYQGHVADINAPLATARPEGILNALATEVYPGSTFYVQNTGSLIAPAGFLTVFENSEVLAPVVPPPGGVEIVINGQFQTVDGVVLGRDAFALVQADPTPDSEQFAGYSANSQLNGCQFLGGTCAPVTDPVAAISSEINLFVTSILPDAPSAPEAARSDEEADEDQTVAAESESDRRRSEQPSDQASDPAAIEAAEAEGEVDGNKSPIAPPAPLVNTRPLSSTTDISSPVSGAGNPALLGTASEEEPPDGGGQ